MRRYHSWLAALGIAAATPGLAHAGPWSPFSGNRETRPTTETDAKAENVKLAKAVAKALRSARLVGYDIQVECKNGEATLLGEVPTAEQRALASKATEGVAGVQAVNNRLTVKSSVQQAKSKGPAQAAQTASRSAPQRKQPIQQVQFEDADVASDVDPNQAKANQIASALRAANFVGDNVDIEYLDGVATINGSVSSPQRVSSATAIIKRVPGVRSVDNQLSVEAPVEARPTPRQTGSRTAGRQPIRQVQFDQAGPGGPPMDQVGLPAYPVSAMQGGPGPINGMPQTAGNPVIYDQPNLPAHAWPSQAAYPNYAAVSYPKQYSASAWPYIGPFYPYPQVPLGWRKVQLEWDDGYWQLNFRPRTERWWWFLDYRNW